jgi:hypothetical protein
MNIVVVLIIFVCAAFLFRFLIALQHEHKKTPKLLKAHWLEYAVAKNTAVPEERMKLWIVPPQEFAVRHILSISEMNVTQQHLR